MNNNRLVDIFSSKQKAYASKISILYSTLEKQKKGPIWDCFFVLKVLRP